MKRLIVKGVTIAIMAAALALPLASPAFADTNPPQTPTTGQPGSSAGVACEVSSNALMTPGDASDAFGSPFNEPMINSPNGGTAGLVYAGQTGSASAANSNSTAAVGQYDVACRNVSSPQP